jgi:hypothetical protein
MRCAPGKACATRAWAALPIKRVALASELAMKRLSESILCNALYLPQCCHRSFQLINRFMPELRGFYALSRVVRRRRLAYVALQ